MSEVAPRWQPLSAIERRVVGVLAEKAKTTPESYPLTINAICTGCNQKSNRAPTMQLEPDQVEESLERLRSIGAIGMVEGYGRVNKYRHYLYEWLGVDKVEMAVMTELLLRGDQTEGELRGRAARMEPIRDLNELRPIIESLKSKGLLLSLTPAGRGHVVTHALYQPRELERLKAHYASGAAPARNDAAEMEYDDRPEVAHLPASSAAPPVVPHNQADIDELKAQVQQLRSDLDDLTADLARLREEMRQLRTELGG